MSAVKNVIKDNYNMMLLRDYLREKIKEAGFSHITIDKTPLNTKVMLYVTRPGIAIGRKGAGIRELEARLESDYGLKNPKIDVKEIEKPELSPGVMCNRMASHIERGTAFRRATMWTLQQIMDSGAMGVQITVSGKLRGDRSAFEKHTNGVLPRAGHRADVTVDEDIAHVQTPMGLIGIRIRIARKEKYVPEFEMEKRDAPAEKKPVREQDVKDMTDPAIGEKAQDADPAIGEKAQDADPAIGEKAQDADPAIGEKAQDADPAAAGKDGGARTESEHIAIEEEKMKSLETLEEEEAKMK